MTAGMGWPRLGAGVILLLVAAVGVRVWQGKRRIASASAAAEPSAVRAVPVEHPTKPGTSPDPAAPAGPPSAAPEKSDPLRPPPVLPKPELEFQLPTANQGLWGGPPEQFFMFVDRYTPAGQEQVWQGGNYGFVRNPRQTAEGIIFTKFHEGIDIAPAQRDAKGEPQDEVRAIADGVVGYLTTGPRTSNYGNYVVVLHQIGGSGVFYTLYAHLRSIEVVPGTVTKRGTRLGMLGYTGDGIDRRRAHVHLEIGMILSERYDDFGGGAALNGHGNYHGSNLAGLNAAEFLIANRADPQLMPAAFLQRQEIYYKVKVPNSGRELDLVKRYPWLRKPGPAGLSWEISFTAPGLPVAVAPDEQYVPFEAVSWVKPFGGYHSWNTRSMLGGSGATATLTTQGSRYLRLVVGDF